MSTHHQPRIRGARRALAAIAVTIALVLSYATNVTVVNSLVGLVNTVIGLGGRDDPTASRVPNKLSQQVVPDGYTYIGSEYPATVNMIDSVRVGMPVLHSYVTTTSGKVIVAAYSEGALLAEQEKRNLRGDDDAPSPVDLSFLEVGAPFVPNGGIFARFPGWGIPGLIPAMGAAQPSQYDTTYVTNEYDTYADFPAYFNPIALLNTALAVRYAHPDASYDPLNPNSPDNLVKVVKNTAGGTDTYILVPNPRLPLLGPLRDIAAALHLTPLSERLLGAIEPLLRVMVDMAYTDRKNLNPEVSTHFSLITPPHKILEALAATPGAISEGLSNLLGVPAARVAPAMAPALRGATDSGRPALQAVEPAPKHDSAPAAIAESEPADSSTAPAPDPEPATKPEDPADKTSEKKPSEMTGDNKVSSTTTVDKKKPGGRPDLTLVPRAIRTVPGADHTTADTTVSETTKLDSTELDSTKPETTKPEPGDGSSAARADQAGGDTGAAAA